jgi:hypothetical protein
MFYPPDFPRLFLDQKYYSLMPRGLTPGIVYSTHQQGHRYLHRVHAFYPGTLFEDCVELNCYFFHSDYQDFSLGLFESET